MVDSTGAEEIGAEEPLLGGDGHEKGGIRALPFIIANESLESSASNGLSPNLTRYLMGEYGMTAVRTSNLLYLWSFLNGLTPVLGAFLADSYVGRYRTIVFGSIFSSLGMALLWLTAAVPQARPSCDKLTAHCDSSTPFQLLLLLSSFGLMSIGAGGIRASSLAFGGDQLGTKTNHKNAAILESFIGWYYVGTLVGSLFGMTVIVYIQDNIGWNLGFGIPAALMFFSMLSFLLASPLYVKVKPSASLFTAIFQVIAASYRKRNVSLSSKNSHELYNQNATSIRQKPSEKLSFLNKACVITNPEEDTATSDPWSLCTVDQVEDLKAIINIIPIWLAGILFSVSFNQNTLSYLQVSSMDRHITANFEIPTGSFTMFLFICLGIWVFTYDRLLIPLATKIRGKPTRMKPLQKIGFGIFLSCLSAVSLAIVETKRRAMAIEEGFSDDPHAVVKMSAFWLLPHYIFGGMGDACCILGQNEFYYSQLPKSMSSIATSFTGLGMSAGSLVAGFIMTAVDKVTKAGGQDSWVSSNINKGHYNYYFFLIGALCFLDFLYFVACSRRSYGPCDGEENESSLSQD